MDIPHHRSVDIYQIHRTPFFRRLHRRDSDEFERLKLAYESVRNFDEKPLEAQVKKIRLGKLFRRIKDSFTSSRTIRPNKQRLRPKSKQQLRREALAKARQIGIDYSRQNLGGTGTLPGFDISQGKHDPLQEWKKEKSRLERRLEYGNSQSQVNRSKFQRTQNSQKCAVDYAPQPVDKKGLETLQKNLPKEDFMKFLIDCLSSEKLSPEVVKSFEEILQSKSGLYWDLVEAIDQRQEYIKRYDQFMKKLSSLACKDVSQTKSKKLETRNTTCVETFNSKTNITPGRYKSPEVFIRTYRYSDADEFLPPPTESLLRIPEDISESSNETPVQDAFLHKVKIENRRAGSSSSHAQKITSARLSAKLLKTLQADPAIKKTISQKFGEIIRETVRKESAVMLAHLEKAMKH